MLTREELTKRPRSILEEELRALRERIANNMRAENAVASGRTIASMQVEVEDEGADLVGTLYGRNYFGALETGSQKWRNQYARVPKFFADIIQEWINAKGLDLNAWAVATKIMREGSLLHRQGGRDTIYSHEIEKTLDNVQKRMLAFWQVVSVEHITLNNKQ